jgi:hypothetical protein
VAEEGAGGRGEEERGIGEGGSKRDWKRRRRGGSERIGECAALGRREREEEVDGRTSGSNEKGMGSEGEEN